MDKSNERVDPKANLGGNNKFTWNDHKCLEISARDVFPSQVTDTDIQKEIITKFLNFYLSGKIRKGLTVCDVTFATISIMPRSNTEEQFIWPSLEYKDHGSLFHISAEDKLKAEIDKLQCSNDKKSQVDGNTSEEIDKPGTSNKDQDTIIIDKLGTSNEDQDTIIIDKPGTSDEEQEIADIDYNEENEVEKRTNSAKKYHSIEQRNVEDEAQKIDENEECSEAQFTHQMNGTETGAATPKESTPKLPSGIKWERIRSKRTTNILNYGPVQNAAFTAHCNNLLEKWDEDAAARIELKLIFGYIALTLMRATAKSPKHLANTFSSERFITSMQQLIGVSLPFCIPHKKCLKKTHRVLSKRDINICIMFGKIVFWSVYILNSEVSQLHQRTKIFTATVLSHTFNYGMGILGMLQSIQSGHEDEYINILFESTLCNETEESWDNIRQFIDCYMLKSSKHETYHWARIIDKNALNLLGCQHNYALSVIFGVFIEKKFGNTMVWESAWAKNSAQLEHYKALGANMYKKCSAKISAIYRVSIG